MTLIKIFKLIFLNYTAILLTFFLLINNIESKGQSSRYEQNTEIGFFGGGSYYLGDLNDVHFNSTNPNAGLIIRRNIDKRFSYKAEFMLINISSDERNSKDSIASDRGLHFSNNMFEENGSPIYEVSGQVEFNFLPYELGNPLYVWTPFVYTGISIFHFNPKAENKNGEWVELQPLGTEGQGTTAFPERKKYSLIQFSLPIGAGVKIAISEYFNLIFEYGIRKTFTDYLDDVSTTYAGKNPGAINEYPIGMSQEAAEMSDPSQTHIIDEERGDPNKKDWYSFAGITLSFKMPKKNLGCDY